jgi:hypothetical protein
MGSEYREQSAWSGMPLEDVGRRRRRYGDFSTLNRTWNQGRSTATHERLQANPEEWAHYHTLYREARKDWAVVPYDEMIRWCQQRSGYVIGDFGCGEARLAEAVSDRHTVYSFDHVAVNDDVVACDMAHVPLEDEVRRGHLLPVPHGCELHRLRSRGLPHSQARWSTPRHRGDFALHRPRSVREGA